MGRRPQLLIEGIRRRFGAIPALDGVSFAVDAGEVVAVLGENGAGKSTLVEILVGGLRVHGGAMHLGGEAYRPADPRHARRRGVVAVHQHFQLVEAFTVAENLELVADDTAAVARCWAALADDLDLDLPPLHGLVSELGVGDRQWLEIGKALLLQPSLLLLDEPTAVLTPGEADRLFAAVARLSDRGTAVLFITHRLDEVRRVADRAVVLRSGRVVDELPADSDPMLLARAMTGELPPASVAEGQAGPVVAHLEGVSLPPKLHPLDLELRSGQVTVLAGVDGNGQVAVAERLAGFRRGPGSVTVGGSSFVDPGPHTMREAGVGFIPSDRVREGLLPSMPVAENLIFDRREALAGRFGWLDLAGVTALAGELIERYSIHGGPSQPVAELSGGNQQKVMVARALAGRPRVLVAVHPTRGLDVAAQRSVHGLLLGAAASGSAILLVTSDLDEAIVLGDRILVFSRGRVVGEGDRHTPADELARWVGGEAA